MNNRNRVRHRTVTEDSTDILNTTHRHRQDNSGVGETERERERERQEETYCRSQMIQDPSSLDVTHSVSDLLALIHVTAALCSFSRK